MPKAASKKRNSAAGGSPYSRNPSSAGASNAIFKMNMDLGQHVLKNPGVAQAIVDKADLKQSDVSTLHILENLVTNGSFKIVLEVGPGTGNLTTRILEKAKKVVAVELDPRMAAELTKRVQGKPEQKRLEVLLGDVVKTDLPYFDVCISNTPYQISSPLTFKLLALSPAPRTCILMFQREFAARLFARPGDRLYSRLSANAQMWARVEHVMKVGRNNFRPAPQVESSVVRLAPRTPRPRVAYEEWDGLLRVCFVRKNKTLRANFLGASSVVEMLEANWRTWCARNDVAVEDGPVDGDAPAAAEEPMAVDEAEDGDEEEWTGFDDDEEEDQLPALFKEEAGFRSRLATPKTNSRKKRGKATEVVREKIRKVLEDVTALGEKRARNCDQGDFLKLLWAFNNENIHFA